MYNQENQCLNHQSSIFLKKLLSFVRTSKIDYNKVHSILKLLIKAGR